MLPRRPGTYVLIVHLPRSRTIIVGKLGEFSFPGGWYAYAGSARGPGGLAARVARHRRETTTRHWHIDYLRAHAEPVSVWHTVGSQRLECSWAGALSELPGASAPAPGFGASDCRCPAHLVRFPVQPDPLAFDRLVTSPVSDNRLDA
jgi:Uri superfamily endonuclease